jgi:putative ABC transport system permease protein
MIFNYLKIAWRNLLKYRFISFINLFGLTVGLTCCLLILTYILHELSYDKFHSKADRIYRVQRTFMNPDNGITSLSLGTVAPPVSPLLENDFKEIQSLTRLFPTGTIPVRYEDKKFNEPNTYFADENLFNVFDVKMLKGNPKQALDDPFSILMTPEMAKKYFGNEDPIDKMLKLDNQFNCKVTGIFQDLPSNSHIHPQILISFNTLKDSSVYGAEKLRTNWGNNSFFTYILLPENYNPKRLEAQFPAFLNRHIPYDGNAKHQPSTWTKLNLQSLTGIHLRSHTDLEAEENGDIKRVYIFSAIALFILLIACINYMNLSTARSALRAREIGVRKVVGALRKEIILQFLSESVLVAFVATILALLLTQLALPWLNNVSGQTLSIRVLYDWRIIGALVLVPFVVGILSGLYPAIFMSSFQPAKVLKGLFKVGGNQVSFRRVLVTAQFAISIILIICTVIVFRQLSYMQKKSLGFDREHLVTMPYPGALNGKFESFRTALLDNSYVISAGRSSRIPTGRLLDENNSAIDRGDSLVPTNADIKFVSVDQDFVSTYGIHVVAGRGFSRDFGTDTSAYLVNEAAVKALGLKSNDEAVGKMFSYGDRKGRLIGVINDFHFESMHQKIVPLVLLMPPSEFFYGRISVKISGKNIPAALAHIEKTWKQFLPETPYEFSFLDENFARLYESEQRQGTIFTIFSFIAIFLACLGLFGLSAFAISQRIKEIGIRKVLGASTASIVNLLSMDFLKLVGISAVFAFPVAYYAMHLWLEDFAYRINIPWWAFIMAGIIAAAIALGTIGIQAIKAALSNPVKNLRTE